MARSLAFVSALAVAAASTSSPTGAQAPAGAPMLLRDTQQILLSPRQAVPLAGGDLYLVLESPALFGETVLVRQGRDGAVWRRRLGSVDSIAVHESGDSAIVRRINQSLELLNIDPDGRRQWAVPITLSSGPGSTEGQVAAGPDGIAGFVDAAQYCEVAPGMSSPRCVTLPDHGITLSGTTSIDRNGAWVHYLSPQQQLKVARVGRDGSVQIVASLAGQDRTILPLAANERASWLRVVENGTSNLQIVRISAVGAVAQATRPFQEVQAVALGDALVAVFEFPTSTVERLDGDLQVTASAAFAGRPFRIAVGGAGRTCVMGRTQPDPARAVLRCYGPGLQPEPETLLSDDADVAFPFAVAVGENDALAHWGDVVVPGGGSEFSTQSVVRRVPQGGPADAPQAVDRIDTPLSLGSASSLARAASGDFAVLGSARLFADTSQSAVAWAARLPNAGGPPTTYKGPAANGDTLVAGVFEGDDLLGWSQWTPTGVYFNLPPVVTRLHRIPADTAAASRTALPSPVAGQRRTSVVLPIGARWIVAGTDFIEESGGTFRTEAYVLAHDAVGSIEWQRRYGGGDRGRPYVVPTTSGLVVAHAWRDTAGAPGTPTQCVVEGLSAAGSVLWVRSLPARTCGAVAADTASDAVLTTALSALSAELVVESLSAASGATLASNAVPFDSGIAPAAVAPVDGGWRVLGRAGSGATERLELMALDSTLALAWRRPLQTSPGLGRPAMVVLSGGKVDVAVIAGDSTRSVLSRWRVGQDGSAALVDRIDADTGGFTAPSDARTFAVALLATGGDTSLMAATLFEPGGNEVVRLSSLPDVLFGDSFD